MSERGIILGIAGIALGIAATVWLVTKWMEWAAAKRARERRERAEIKRRLKAEYQARLENLALTCRRCGQLAQPIPDTANRYRCQCGHQFVAAKDNVSVWETYLPLHFGPDDDDEDDQTAGGKPAGIDF
jgi:hypothetical protein